MAQPNDTVQMAVRPRRHTRLTAWLRGVVVFLLLTLSLAACTDEAAEPGLGGEEEGIGEEAPAEEEVEP